jgi:hypothetical protein
MAAPSLEDLAQAATTATGPALVSASLPKPGGVDPLGLRQINFDMMDQLLPGLNNVARHIRPFVVVAWAWWRASEIAKEKNINPLPVKDALDFVDRVEVIYAWSQFMTRNGVDLPGSDVLRPLIEAEEWTFGGPDWAKRRETRKYSTAFTAALNYGPGLKMLHWVAPHPEMSDVLIPTLGAMPAVAAFDAQLSSWKNHPVFSEFGTVTISHDEVVELAEVWPIDQPTEGEKQVARSLIFQTEQEPNEQSTAYARRNGGALVLAAASSLGSSNTDEVRREMGRLTANALAGTRDKWRELQMRQLFRFCMESLLYWTLAQLEDGPMQTRALVDRFLDETTGSSAGSAKKWLGPEGALGQEPTDLISSARDALTTDYLEPLPEAIRAGIALSLAEAQTEEQPYERTDRLPLLRARKDYDGFADRPVGEFIAHIIEDWLLAQHTYWSVGRGMSDARAGGKRLLRLRIVLDEGGWTLAPGATRGNVPQPTADRLETALRLAQECDLLPSTESSN